MIGKIVSVLILVCACLSAAAAPSQAGPDPARWQTFLARYLDASAADGIHRIRYAAVTPADKVSLRAYIKSVQDAPFASLTRDEQRALWINLYNAETVVLVLDHYPLKSVRDIELPGSPKPGPWDAKILKVEGKDRSLNDIESGILRPQWKDPRIHFALNCASLGCPNLSAKAFTAANTEKQLDAGARAFLASPRAVAFGKDGLELSSIFDWYRSDFGASEKDVLAFIARYAPPEFAARLKTWSGKIAYEYDWSLNDASMAASAASPTGK